MYSMYRNADPPSRKLTDEEAQDFGDRFIRELVRKKERELGIETESEEEEEIDMEGGLAELDARLAELDREAEISEEELARIRDAPATFRTPPGMRPLEEGETEEEKEEVEELEVILFEYEGKEYLRDKEGRVYDPITEDEVGEWDDETKTLTLD